MLFNQSAKLLVEGLEFEYPNFHMDFNYSVEADNTPGVLEINIYNMSDTNINALKIDQKASFQFGYDDDIGELCSGIVKSIETEKGIDKKTKLTILEANISYNKDVNITYERLSTASYIINDIAQKNSLYVKKLDLLNDFRYETGFTAKGKVLDIIKKIVSKAGSLITIKNNFVYIYNDKTAKVGNIIISYDSGLIKEPKKNVDKDRKFDYAVESLPIHYLKKGDIFQLVGNSVKGNVRIKNFEISDWKATYYVGGVK